MRRVRIAAIFTILILSTGIVFSDARAAKETKEFSIVTSFYPMYTMAANVVKGVPDVSLDNLTPPMVGCLHDYALTTSDMKKLANAQLFVANGAGMESFLKSVAVEFPHLKVIELADGIPTIKNKTGEANPHVWLSVPNAIREVENLSAALSALDPAHTAAYQKNAADYIRKLTALNSKMKAELAPFKGRKIITFHEAFPYFAKEFGLEIAAVVEREPGSEPSAKDLADTIDLVKRSGIKVLFGEPQYPTSAAETIAKETGAKVYLLDPAVTGPEDSGAYLGTMEKNLETLKQALQ